MVPDSEKSPAFCLHAFCYCFMRMQALKEMSKKNEYVFVAQ